MPVSCVVSNRRSRPHAKAADQNSAPAHTTATCASMPFSLRCSRRAFLAATCCSSTEISSSRNAGPVDVESSGPFPACLFLRPFGHVADALWWLNKHLMDLRGSDRNCVAKGTAQWTAASRRFQTPPPSSGSDDVMGQLRDCVGNNVRAISSLIPRLVRHDAFSGLE